MKASEWQKGNIEGPKKYKEELEKQIGHFQNEMTILSNVIKNEKFPEAHKKILEETIKTLENQIKDWNDKLAKL